MKTGDRKGERRAARIKEEETRDKKDRQRERREDMNYYKSSMFPT